MAVIYTTAILIVVASFITGIMELRGLKKKVNGQFTKAIAPEVKPWKS